MFVTIKDRRGEQIINTDHIIRITPPRGSVYTIWMDEIDYEDERITNLWFSVVEPKYEELKEKLCG